PAYLLKLDDHDPGARKRAAAAVDQLFGKGNIASPLSNPTVDAIRVQTVALAALAVVAGLAVLVTVAQATGRIVAAGAAERTTWGSLGMTAAQRGRAAAAPALVAGVVATTVAGVAAAPASSRLPRGRAGLGGPP